MRSLLFVLSSAAALADIIPDVRGAIAQNQIPAAERMVEAYQKQRGTTPEMIEAMSWLARAAGAQKQYSAGGRDSKEVMRLAAAQMAKQAGRLDAEPHLPTAVGAAIE